MYSVSLKQWQMKYLMGLIENEVEGPLEGITLVELRELWFSFDDPLDIVYPNGKRPDFIEEEYRKYGQES